MKKMNLYIAASDIEDKEVRTRYRPGGGLTVGAAGSDCLGADAQAAITRMHVHRTV